MNLELYLAFVLATVVLILIPGPNVALIVANSLSYGARTALMTVAGTSSAMVFQLAITAVGMTSVLLVLAAWFEWLRWLGVAYLVYLGIRAWRAPAEDLDAAPPSARGSGRRLFWQGFLVSATNPKVLLFYAAFFPQFVDPARPLALQLGLLSATFLVIAVVLDSGFALAAGHARSWLRGAARARLRNRLTGGFLIGAGLGLALARRS
ncbi:MAG: LysE family translocator [Alphaproteobacteria bacterium]|nr:LysE family translocator [Alphaproteobacteria bacterium]